MDRLGSRNEFSGADSAFALLDAGSRRRMEQLGPVWGRDLPSQVAAVLSTYDSVLVKAPSSTVAISRNRRYGPHPRQWLDAFVPQNAHSAPMVLFLHGGAFVRGAARETPLIYDNVLRWFARHGYIGLNVEYRLAPDVAYPEGGRDVARVIAWAREHGPDLGGDPDRLFLIGHSAGATHVATWLCDPVLDDARASVAPPSGAVLISGRLRVDAAPSNPNALAVQAYFGADPDSYEARSAVTHAHRLCSPALVVVAEHENPLLDIYGREFHQRARDVATQRCEFLAVARHNHVSIVAHFDTGEVFLGEQVLRFMASC